MGRKQNKTKKIKEREKNNRQRKTQKPTRVIILNNLANSLDSNRVLVIHPRLAEVEGSRGPRVAVGSCEVHRYSEVDLSAPTDVVKEGRLHVACDGAEVELARVLVT